MAVKGCVLLHLGSQESRRRCSTCCRHPKTHVPTDPAAAWRWHAPQRPALSPIQTSVCLVHLRSLWDVALRHTRGLLDNPLLIDHQGLCTAHCQATIPPLSHLLPTGHLRRHAIPATLQGAPHEALWLPFGSPLTVQPGSKQIPYLLAPTCTHMVYHLLRAP